MHEGLVKRSARKARYQRVFRTVPVPDDLATVTDIDTAAEVKPQRAGLDPAAVNAVWDACQALYRSGVYPMLSLCLRRQGKIVINRSLGHLRNDTHDDNRNDSRNNSIATVNTPICAFSASKSVSAVLMHLLAQQGAIDLSTPVCHYLPAFAAKGKGNITTMQLLTHRGGIAKLPKGTDIDLLYDHDAALALICETAPTYHESRFQGYHTLTSGFICNELIKVTTGLDAQQYLHRYISKPMGMRYFRFGLTQRDQKKVAVNATTGPVIRLADWALSTVLGTHPETAVRMTNDPRFYRAIIPSANLFCTAEEMSRFYQMLLNHGEWQGTQILEPLTVHHATRAVGNFELDRSLMLPMRYSAGFMLGGSPIGMYGLDTQHAFGHLGYANIFSWADPQRDIAVSLMNTGKLALGPHLIALPALLHAISKACPSVNFTPTAPGKPSVRRKKRTAAPPLNRR
jgi:CubicO group peptidase (beta-lactamase class C family)